MRGTLRDQFRGKHPFFWVVVVAAVIGVCLYTFVVTMHVKYAALTTDGYDWTSDLRITRIYPQGPAVSKLQAGDKILKLDDKAATYQAFVPKMVFSPIGTEYSLEVARNGQHDFSSAVSSDYHEREKLSRTMTRDLHLPEEAFVVQRIHNSAQPAEIDWDDPYSPVATQLAAMANGDAAAQQEFDTLRELKTNLVLPLSAKDELLGVLALGPRAGDLPYSREDKRLLMNVAGQTAMALENSRLIEQKIEIEAEHNRKTQELEEARRLQLSMLPKGNVQLERLEITGAIRTATEVGGDYYDFLPLPDGRYCVVIGDATGHGMSAGLIVGMVKMGLTSRLQAQANLQPMIEDLNAALKQSLTHRGVGMCLGATMIDPITLQVELCSNGMPFPYHFANGTLRAIELKAPPLGFLKRVNVPTATLQLHAGDVLIWVSDGFEERMNARGECWGTEQVAAALTEICARETSGAAMARALIAACDRASDGRNNDDDMTIVVVKVMSESA
jgi:sigma-B regulation protein RsbU (phosphoserine phosphatase)